MELTYLRTRMDNCWFGYNGVSTFSSMTYEKLAKLESQLGMMSNRINSYTYNPQTPVYNMIHALKYVVNNTTPNVISDAHYKQVANEGKYTAYAVKETLPLGFLTHSALEYWDTTSTNPFDVQQDFFTLSTNVNDELFSPLSVAYVNYDNTDPFTEDLSGNSFYFQKSDRKADSEASATFTLLAPKDQNVYIFYQVDGASAKDITINSEEGAYSRNASQNSILDLGAFDEGESINVTIPFERENGYVHFYAYTLNESVFQKGYAVLNDRTLQISEQTDTTVEGTFSARERSILFTSIPYDDGWSVEIDGEPAAPSDIVKIGDALLGVRVEKGNHSIRLHYTIPGMKAGLLISLATAVLLALYLLLFRRRRPTLFNTERVRWSERLFLPEKKPAFAVAPANEPAPQLPKREVFRPAKTPKREVFTPPQPPVEPPQQNTAEAAVPFEVPQAVVGSFSQQETMTNESRETPANES